jgi:hypothetical protein
MRNTDETIDAKKKRVLRKRWRGHASEWYERGSD